MLTTNEYINIPQITQHAFEMKENFSTNHTIFTNEIYSLQFMSNDESPDAICLWITPVVRLSHGEIISTKPEMLIKVMKIKEFIVKPICGVIQYYLANIK